MLTIKNPVAPAASARIRRAVALEALVGLLLALAAGCSPPGPRALLQGQRLIEQGNYPEAVEKLRVATTLLFTNAQAWNYLGVACQHVGEPVEAQKAYQRALALDHDLSEAHYNLGSLWLAQSNFDGAKTELTAFTLRRGNSVEGFLKLGSAQLRTAEHEPSIPARARELSAAEKSFNEALRLNPRNSEALNSLGLLRIQQRHPGEAAPLFSQALKEHPGYPPALLNLAIVSHQYLKDYPVALQKYREYLALKPAPDNVEAVRPIVRQLELEITPLVQTSVARVAAGVPTNQPLVPPRPSASVAVITNPPKPIAATAPAKSSTPTNAPKALAATNVPGPPARVELVKVPDEPVLKVAEDISRPASGTQPGKSDASTNNPSSPLRTADAQAAQRGLLQRMNPLNLFHGDSKSAEPIPSRELASSETNLQSPPEFDGNHYAYKSPPKPTLGDRVAAERSYAQGVQAQQSHRPSEAVLAYRKATQIDPTYFDAHYNLGLAATEAGDLRAALTAYEYALAVRPDSLDARYNFALVLKQANYLADSAREFEKVLAQYPQEARAHLALGNMYAQQLHDPAKARQHYLKILEIDSQHPQAGAIRYWLAGNPR